MTHARLSALCIGLLCLAGRPGAARAQDDGGATMTVYDREGARGSEIVFSLHDIGSIRFIPCEEIIVRLNDGTERRIDALTYEILRFTPCDVGADGMPPAAAPGMPSPASLAVALFPNPTSSSLTIEITSGRSDRASVTIHDLTGTLVWGRDAVELSAGVTQVTWSGANMAGTPVPSGTYVVRVSASGRESTRSVNVTR